MKTIGIVAEGPHDFELIAAVIDTTWIVAAFDQYENYEVLSDPWTNIIAHAPQYHGIKIRNRPHKAKRTYEELISVVCDNRSDVIAKCPQAKRFDEDVRRFLIK